MITVKYRDDKGNEKSVELTEQQAQAFFDEYWLLSESHHNHPARRKGYLSGASTLDVVLANSLTRGAKRFMLPLRDAAHHGDGVEI